ncbi:MAG: glycoside hydrolase family 65 protein, partial [Actinobacteria bacterium]|nr:glycoside hydrolase family 65 protein [Actinomycetota bacterium]
YILPFLIYTHPRIARNLLRFRHSMLDLARQRAREVNQVGALFPWRTINGEEASAYFEAGTAQYHINAAVIHAVKKYVEVTGDDGFLVDTGAELLLSTARLWLDLGFHSPDGAFHIHGVTGPDEYTTVVNDNTYTNLMAQLHLHYAADVVDWLAEHHPERYRALVDKVGFGPDEAEAWRAAADAMFVPYDNDLGINPQDTNFLEKELWDFAATPLDKYPLLLNYHPLVIYRHQVIKQADVVLAMFLCGDSFNTDQKRRNFDYYDPLTTGDSSLSAGVQSIVAAEVGYPEQSLDYFRQALFTDLCDLHGNAADGVHLASTGAVWMNLVYGFAGLRDYNGQLSFDPRLPADWPSLAFSLTVSERLIDVEITHEQVSYHLRDGNDIAISVRGNKVKLTAGDPVTIALGPAERAGVS